MSCPTKIAGIILAAGHGSRMGGTVKQMLPFKGKTMLECVIENATASYLHRLVVVIGHQADMIAPIITGHDITVVTNRDYRIGQSSSIKAGMKVVTEETDAVMFLLGDQPLVTAETINLLIDAFQASGAPIVLPTFGGRRGNPVLFSRETFPRLELLERDCGARPLFTEYRGRILEVPVGDKSIHFDVDSEEDYRRLMELDI